MAFELGCGVFIFGNGGLGIWGFEDLVEVAVAVLASGRKRGEGGGEVYECGCDYISCVQAPASRYLGRGSFG